MNKYKRLLQNSSIFLIANFGSKLISFLLVRFYTEVLTPAEYGIIDIITTTVNLAVPIVSLCITEAVLRFSIDDIDNRKTIFSMGILTALVGNIAFTAAAPVLMGIKNFHDYVLLILLLTATNCLYLISAHFSRGIGQSKVFAFSGLLYTILQIGCNLLFLLVFKWGIQGYLLSTVVSSVLSTAYIIVFGKIYRYVSFEFKPVYLKQMLLYSIPLIPNSAFWWIMQSSDRYVISSMMTEADNGLYAVANKIPTIITTVSAIFFQAWQLSSVEESDSKDKKSFFSNVFNALSMVLICSTSFLMLILQPLYKLLVESSYYSGWQSTPYLLIAMVFSCFASFLGTNYVAMKKTKGAFVTTVIGAIINIVLNILLTPIWGIKGTALATAIAFLVTWLARMIDTKKFVRIKYSSLTLIISLVILMLQGTLLALGKDSVVIQAVLFTAVILLHIKLIIGLIKFGVGFIRKLFTKSTGA